MLVRLDLPSAGGGTEAGVPSPRGANVWVKGETFKAESETADLWKPKWNENHTVLSVAIHTPDRAVDPLKGTVGELEFRDCGEVPWRGLLLTAERRILGM